MTNNNRKLDKLIKKLAGMRLRISELESKHKQADELVLQSIHNWEDTFNNITDMITIHDRDYNIIHANKAAEKILGLSFLKSSEAKCFRSYHGADSPPKGCPSCKCLETGEPVVFERFEPHLNRFVEIRAMPQFDSRKQLIGLIHIVRDITERKMMEQALQKAHDELEKRMEEEAGFIQAKLIHANKMTSLGTLVSGVAHEINNPNTFIRSNSQFLSKTWKDVSRVLGKYCKNNGDFIAGGLPYSEVQSLMPQVIQGIDEGSARIRNIVDNLRSFVRPEKANLDGKVNVNEVVLASKTILGNLINKYTVRFQLSCGKDIPLVRGSSQQIEQVIINLIMNALQALKNKDGGVRVSTSHSPKSKSVVIKIKDEGTGMTKDTLERITEPFFTTKIESGGTGLGLSISYAIIKEHKGTLEFRSEYGKGTTVVVKLPVYK